MHLLSTTQMRRQKLVAIKMVTIKSNNRKRKGARKEGTKVAVEIKMAVTKLSKKRSIE